MVWRGRQPSSSAGTVATAARVLPAVLVLLTLPLTSAMQRYVQSG